MSDVADPTPYFCQTGPMWITAGVLARLEWFAPHTMFVRINPTYRLAYTLESCRQDLKGLVNICAANPNWAMRVWVLQ